ncbi:MAG TPA: ribosome maturation factor RimM [Actinomycetales bacterium]|nr:ribosome maturation factor RimM [Actinomycetales bacterium]
MERVVARIGRAHGLHGEVSIEVRTDVPEQRFVPGAVFDTEPADRGPLTLVSARDHRGVLLLAFEQAADRAAAEALRDTMLVVQADASDEEDAWYEDELVGLRVEDPEGQVLGELVQLETGGAQDLLVVRPAAGGAHVRVPFVSALVPVVDVAGGRVVVDPPGGLFDRNES